MTEWSMKMFSLTEQFNRRVTFLAAYDLAVQNPTAQHLKDTQDKFPIQYAQLMNRWGQPNEVLAYLSAVDAVDQTQFNYARWARPKFMRGRASTLFMFYLFTQNMLFLGLDNKSAGARMLLTSMYLGGLMGVPGMEDAEEIIKAMAARIWHKDVSIEKFARKHFLDSWAHEYIVEVLGEETGDRIADAIIRGSSRYSFGAALFDLPGVTIMPSFDVSGSISMGHILPINPAFLLAGAGTGYERTSSEILNEVAGAAFGVGLNFYKALTDGAHPFQDYRQWERALPTSLRNVSRAIRWGYSGEETSASGTSVMKYDPGEPEGMAELIGVGLGINPTARMAMWDRIRMQGDFNHLWTAKRKYVYDLNDRARRGLEDRVEARKALDRFNAEAPKSYKISRESFQRSMETRQRVRVRGAFGGARTRQERSAVEEIRKLYPDAEDIRGVKIGE